MNAVLLLTLATITNLQDAVGIRHDNDFQVEITRQEDESTMAVNDTTSSKDDVWKGSDGSWLCMQLGSNSKDIAPFLQKYGVTKDTLASLKEAVAKAPTASFNTYKGSEVARAMEPFETTFEAQNLNMYLTVEGCNFCFTVTFRICFVDRGSKSVPPEATVGKTYRKSGGWIKPICLARTHFVPDGVGIVYFEKMVTCKKAECSEHPLTVDVLRIIKRAKAEQVQKAFLTDLAKVMVETGGSRGEHAAAAELVTRHYKTKFAHHGIGLFFIRVVKLCYCGSGRHRYPCWKYAYWFEYAQITVGLTNYVPNVVDAQWKSTGYASGEWVDYSVDTTFPKVILQRVARSRVNGVCSDTGKKAEFAKLVNWEYELRDLLSQGTKNKCSQVIGAVPRENKKGGEDEDCKCRGKYSFMDGTKDELVCCGDKCIANSRKFNVQAMYLRGDCSTPDMYCATEAQCPLPVAITEE